MKPIRIIKLFSISVIVFSVMLFCLSLVFPSTTYVSRAVNVKGEKNNLNNKMLDLYFLAFQDDENSVKEYEREKQRIIDSFSFRDPRPLKDSGFTQKSHLTSLKDTLLFTSVFSRDIRQGIAVYQAGNDSSTIQLFYKIHVPFYKPWQKFALMLNESKYGPSLDSAISRISQKF